MSFPMNLNLIKPSQKTLLISVGKIESVIKQREPVEAFETAIMSWKPFSTNNFINNKIKFCNF